MHIGWTLFIKPYFFGLCSLHWYRSSWFGGTLCVTVTQQQQQNRTHV